MENTPNQKVNPKILGLILTLCFIVIVLLVLLLTKTEKVPVAVVSDAPATSNSVSKVPVVEGQVMPEGSRVAASGAVLNKDNVVVTKTGEVAKNDVAPLSENAPKQSAPISKEDLPAEAVKMDVSELGFKPSNFSVSAGAPVTISVSSVDDLSHVLVFDAAELSAIAIIISPGETRAITFNAPSKPGEYSFYCNVPGHKGRGEFGSMTVK